MPRSTMRMSTLAPLFIAAVSLLLVACGGGGGSSTGGGTGGTSGSTIVADTSFQGFPSVQGGGLPPVLRDELLEIELKVDVDDGIFGGFFTDVGQVVPTTFQGGRLVNGTTVNVAYFAYANQAAARSALQILDDTGATVGSYTGIVGRHATKRNTIVFDPNVGQATATLFGLTMSQGFAANTQYDVFIPANSGFTSGGSMIPTFGSLPPVVPPQYSASQNVSQLFLTGPGFLDRPAPSVMTITSANTELISGVAGVDPIPYNDTIIVRFTESIDVNTIDLQNNLIIRNLGIVNSQQPSGVLVPVTFTIDSVLRELRFTPQPSFGSGPFQIVVQVVKFDETDMVEDAKNIRGLPSGATAVQKALAGPTTGGVIAQVAFTTIAQPGEPNPISIIENFDSIANLDPSFNSTYNAAEWFANSVEQLRGFAINGAPFQTQLGTGAGARVQFTFQPAGTANPGNPFCTTPLCTYSSPFDDNQINNGLNPNGGSRIQLLYLTNNTELPNNTPNSIELVEWSPPNQTASMVTYNGYSMEIGHTGSAAGGTNTAQITTIYPSNFDFDNPQNSAWILPQSHPDINNSDPDESPILCFGPAPYTVTQLAGTFIPFPRLTVPFDINDTVNGPNSVGQSVSPHVIVEHEVPSPHVTMNNLVNVVVGTNETTPTPFRRAIGSPGVNNAIALDAVKHHTRMTIAKKNSSARSRYYTVTTMAPSGSTFNYSSLSVSPAFTARPANSRVLFELRSATSAAGASATAFQTYFDLNGNLNLGALNAISGANRAFFQFQASFEADLLTNSVPFIDSLIFGITF